MNFYSNNLDNQSINLICGCSYDADGESEDKGHGTSKEEPPPRKLNLILQDCAEDKRYRNC